MFDKTQAINNIYRFTSEEPFAFFSCFDEMKLSDAAYFELLKQGDYSQFSQELGYYFDVNFHDFIEWLSDDGLSVSEIQDTFKLVGINTKTILDGEDWDLEIIE